MDMGWMTNKQDSRKKQVISFFHRVNITQYVNNIVVDPDFNSWAGVLKFSIFQFFFLEAVV